jgi:hypothetical protein
MFWYLSQAPVLIALLAGELHLYIDASFRLTSRIVTVGGEGIKGVGLVDRFPLTSLSCAQVMMPSSLNPFLMRS